MAPAFSAEKMRMAARLREARKRANMSQERAAAAVGTSRRHWIRWESGETMPNEAYVSRIAEVLGDPSIAPADEDDDASSSPLYRDLESALRAEVQRQVTAVLGMARRG